jgi:hypothetical protein
MNNHDTNGIIGKVATYHGVEHPYLVGSKIRVVAVVKRPDGDPDRGAVCVTREELLAAGGLAPANDILEVVPWLGVPFCRWGAVPSDVRLADLVDLREEG